MQLIMLKKEHLVVFLSLIFSYFLFIIFDIGCLLNKIFGIECAGCGVTRMFLSILKFDFYQAFRFNPFVFVFLIVSLLYFIYVLVCKLIKKRYFRIGIKTLIVVLVLFVCFGIIRNINGFEFLKPTIVN